MTEDNNALMTLVARMYYLDGLGQSEIAQVYGVSRSKVSRLITEARHRGIVRISVDEYDPRHYELEQRLISGFGLRHVVVVRNTPGADENLRRTVGYFAAAEAAGWIRRTRTVGIAGGRTLGALIQAMEAQPRGMGPDVVQLMGTIGSSPSNVDASELCRMLAHRFYGKMQTVSAPAFVEDAGVRDAFLSHRQIRSVWGAFSSLELAFVGIGTLDESVFADQDLYDREVRAQLRAVGAVGEICGRFFDRWGRECTSPYQDRVISIDLDVLRQCRDVVGVTTGRTRASGIRAAIDGGLVNGLIIDEDGARGVLERVQYEQSTDEPSSGLNRKENPGTLPV